jgi:hypothetical protein
VTTLVNKVYSKIYRDVTKAIQAELDKSSEAQKKLETPPPPSEIIGSAVSNEVANQLAAAGIGEPADADMDHNDKYTQFVNAITPAAKPKAKAKAKPKAKNGESPPAVVGQQQQPKGKGKGKGKDEVHSKGKGKGKNKEKPPEHANGRGRGRGRGRGKRT